MFKTFDYRKSFERDEKCGRYRGKGIAGSVLLGCGIGATTGGVLMIIKGLQGGFGGSSNDDLKNFGLIYGGYIVSVLGIAMTGAGTALTAVGFSKMRKYCRDDESFFIIPRANSISFAYRF